MSFLSKYLAMLSLPFSSLPEMSRDDTVSTGTDMLSRGEFCRHHDTALAAVGLLSWTQALCSSWQEYWVSKQTGKEDITDSLDVKMVLHSPGRTDFNTIQNAAYYSSPIASLYIFPLKISRQWLMEWQATWLAGWHGYSLYSSISPDVIVISLTHSLKLHEF